MNLFTSNQLMRLLSVSVVRAIAMFQLWLEEIRLNERIIACFSTQNIKIYSFSKRVNATTSQQKLISLFCVCR